MSNQFLRFFHKHHAELLLTEFDESAYQRLHHTTLHAKSPQHQNKVKYSLTDLIKNPPILQTKIWNKNIICTKYTFETGPRLEFSTQLHS